MKFFAYNSRFMTTLGKIVDYILLGMLWIFASLPIITFGAATTAMLLTVEITLRKNEGKIVKTFYTHFKKEFKQATVLLIIQLPILVILAANLWVLSTSQLFGFFEILIGITSWIVICWIQLWFPYLSKFEDRVKAVLGNTFRITMSNLVRTSVMSLAIVAALLATEVLIQHMPPFVLLIPGLFIMAYTTLLRRLFKRYLVQADPTAEAAEAAIADVTCEPDDSNFSEE